MVRVWMIQAHVCHSTLSKHLPASSNSSTSGGGGGGGVSSNALSSSSTSLLSSSTSTSSWFGFSLSSSSSYDVSSSAGHAGGSGGTKKPECEKIALEILSCLVQLLEKQDLRPATEEQWTQSVALVCLLWNIPQIKVKQAAHSTLPQVLAILYNTATMPNQEKFILHTWEDLLAMTTMPSSQHHHYTGAFAQSTSNKAGTSLPTPEFALELMTKLLRQHEQQQQQQKHQEKQNTVAAMSSLLNKDAVRSKTFGVLLQLLQTKMMVRLELTLRIVAYTSAVIQTLSTSCPNECRELIQILIKFVVQATEACRTQDDFEDGFVYERPVFANSTTAITATTAAASRGRRDSWDLANAAATMSAINNNSSSNNLSMTPPPLANNASPIPGSVKRMGHKKETAHSTLIPNTTLWKAGLALEALYPLLPRPDQPLYSLWEEDSLALLSEAMSDFCTIAASCQDHMLQLIEASYRNDSNNMSNYWNDPVKKDGVIVLTPILFHKAEQLLSSGSNHSQSGSHSSSATAAMNDNSTGGKANETAKERKVSRFPPSDIGQALWVAFHAIIRITEVLHAMAPTLESNEQEGKREEFTTKLLEAAFAPALAALQHYLKRFPGSVVLTRLTLQGYANLASVALPAAHNESTTPSLSPDSVATHHFGMQRKALLASLSKLSLPAWGKRDPSG
jgi:hypothetical protein